MNNDTIWGMWCDTFVGVYDRLDDFDLWYTVNKGPNDPDVTLAEEWGKYNRIVLDSAVRIYRDGWDWTYNNRRRVNLPLVRRCELIIALLSEARLWRRRRLKRRSGMKYALRTGTRTSFI